MSIFTATAKAAMTTEPKEFTRPCTRRIPKFITDCCRQVKNERLQSCRKIFRSHRRSALPTRRSGQLCQVHRARPTPAAYWASTVASAAPMTPICRGMTKSRSRPMFPTTDTPKNSSGVTEFPMARSRLAK